MDKNIIGILRLSLRVGFSRVRSGGLSVAESIGEKPLMEVTSG